VADGCGYYFQRKVRGRVMSVLFLANGREARIIGISEQWNAALKAQPYSYGGAVSDQPVSQRLRAELSFAIEALVEQAELRGLNSMDLVVAGDEFQVLEINARPTATVELYDSAREASLFGLHVQACRGHALPHCRRAGRRHGHLLVYAERGLRVRRGFQWPDWCSDRPPRQTRIGAGEPLCTVHASGSSRAELCGLLERRSRAVSEALLAAARPPGVQRMAESSPCRL
jgi:predicted ATP-grasp superfamily ATP-dependent carboligase